MLVVGTTLLVAAGVAWSAGSSTTNLAAKARKGGTLRLGSETDVDFVDPGLAYATQDLPLQFATCAKLFNYPDARSAAGARVVPEVVKSFTVSRDGRTYVFELKPTFRFHTGAPVTARSFADAFNRDANPRLRSLATNFMREISGAVAVMQGKAQTISGVQVLGRYRLRIRLTRPVGDFTARLTMPFFCPILPNTPLDPDGIRNPPGSGPYYVAEWVPNRRMVLERNPFYGGGRPANVDRVVWTVGKSIQACLLSAEQDRIDNCGVGVPSAATRRLAAQYGINRPGGQFFVSPGLNTSYVAFNHDRPAFKGPGQIALKKAINYAIDRAALARTFYLADQPADQMLPPALGRDARIYPVAGSAAKARTWLARAKLKPPTLVFYSQGGTGGVKFAQVLRSNLKEIGIDLDVRYYEYISLLKRAGTRGEPFDLATNVWFADYADPANFIEPFLDPVLRKTGNGNYSYYSNRRVTARIAAASRLTGAARRKAWADLDADLMRNDPPWAPLTHETDMIFVSPSYGCFLPHPVYYFDIAAACKK
jgi:ABC-type transport system substrate-binding protein